MYTYTNLIDLVFRVRLAGVIVKRKNYIFECKKKKCPSELTKIKRFQLQCNSLLLWNIIFMVAHGKREFLWLCTLIFIFPSYALHVLYKMSYNRHQVLSSLLMFFLFSIPQLNLELSRTENCWPFPVTNIVIVTPDGDTGNFPNYT